VSQLPSLVLATGAGILVTRVASEEADTPLGQELASQIFGAPRALRVASVFVLILAAIPGLPALPFLVIGVLLFLGSRTGTRRAPSAEPSVNEPVQRRDGDEAPPQFVPVVVPWSLDVSTDLAPLLEDDTRGGELRRAGVRAAAAAVQELMFRELGVPLPSGRVAVSSELPERTVVLSLSEVPAKSVTLPDGLADADLAPTLVEEALGVLRGRAADYLGIAETQTLLDRLELVAPATVRQVVPKPVSVLLLADVLRRLVEEGVSIRDLRGILEALAQVAHAEKDPLMLAELVRANLRRALTHQLTAGSGELAVVLLEPMIEETIRGAITRTAAGSYLTLAPAAARDVVRVIRRTVEASGEEGGVILTQPDVRRFVKKLVEVDLPWVRVVSPAELLPEISIRPVGKATLAGA
jgi:type III secretion protein V